MVPIAWLSSAQFIAVCEAGGGPLYLLLWYRSLRGKRPVRVTNTEFARRLGFTRQNKARLLRVLEENQVAQIDRRGTKTPIVTMYAPQPVRRPRLVTRDGQRV